LLAAGIGCFTIGLFTTLAELSAPLKNGLNWYNPAGPLTGKTTLGVAAWLISWVILGVIWKGKSPALARIFTWTLVLIALALLLTFPPFFEAIAGG
jgi:hypothetical protein